MDKIKKAVIVAAGVSSRLYPITTNLPKGLLDVAGETLIGRSIRLLRENSINEIMVVVGFNRDMVQEALGPEIHYRLNPFYAESNNMCSLWFAKEWVGDDPFIYLHSDVIYAPELLKKLVDSDFNDCALLVDEGPTDKEAMKVRIEEGRFVESSKDIPVSKAIGEWVGIAAFKRPGRLFDMIERLLEQGEFQAYDTLAFTRMALEGSTYSIIPTNGQLWVEIDFESDLIRARGLSI
jgi:choline kinase